MSNVSGKRNTVKMCGTSGITLQRGFQCGKMPRRVGNVGEVSDKAEVLEKAPKMLMCRNRVMYDENESKMLERYQTKRESADECKC